MPEQTRDDIERRLLEGQNRQNITLEASYNITTRSLGRTFAQYQSLFDALASSVAAKLSEDELRYSNSVSELGDIFVRQRAVQDVTITFTAGNDTTGATLLLASGAWDALGFEGGSDIEITGPLNAGTFSVVRVRGNTMTLGVGSAVVAGIDKVTVTYLDDTQNPSQIPLKQMPTFKRRQFENKLRSAIGSGALNYPAAFDRELRTSGLSVFGQMVSNQPQLHFTGSRTFRDELFGPRVTTGRIAFETGLNNSINTLRKRAGASCDLAVASATSAATCLNALRTFTQDATTMEDIKSGARLSLFAEFTSQEAYTQTLENVTLTLPAATSWSVGGDVGKLLGVADDGSASARIDGAFRLERPAKSSLANRRAVASVTITKKVGDLSIPFALVYASKPEFLKDVDHQLSATVGVKFNLFAGLN